MARDNDPEGAIPAAIYRHGGLADARLLDIGYGDRRCLLNYARDAAFVVGLDPVEDTQGASTNAGLRFVRGRAESVPIKDKSFDAAVLSWSL